MRLVYAKCWRMKGGRQCFASGTLSRTSSGGAGKCPGGRPRADVAPMRTPRTVVVRLSGAEIDDHPELVPSMARLGAVHHRSQASRALGNVGRMAGRAHDLRGRGSRHLLAVAAPNASNASEHDRNSPGLRPASPRAEQSGPQLPEHPSGHPLESSRTTAAQSLQMFRDNLDALRVLDLLSNPQRLLQQADGLIHLAQVGVGVAQAAEVAPSPYRSPISRAMTSACPW